MATMQNTDLHDYSDEEDWRRPAELPPLPSLSFVDDDGALPNKYNKQIGEVYATTHKRTIVHIDMDCFYAQVEMIRNPQLRDKPIGVQQKSLLATTNYKARELGVKKMMGLREATVICPQLILVNGEDLTHYREMSYRISDFCLKYTSKVERLGFDENFLDVTDLVSERLRSNMEHSDQVVGFTYGTLEDGKDCHCGCDARLKIGSQIAAEIRQALYHQLSLTCCAGIAHNKLLSKLVAGQHKPNQQTTLFPGQASQLLASLSKPGDIPGIGHATAKKLSSLGVHTLADLQNFPIEPLVAELGETMTMTIRQLASGIDDSPVVPFGLPQTLSDEDSFRNCSSLSAVHQKIEELLESLLKRLLSDGRVPRTLRLTVRKSNTQQYGGRESRQCAISSDLFNKFSSDCMDKVLKGLTVTAMNLFHKVVNVKEPFNIVLMNVAFAKMEQRSKNAINSFFQTRAQQVPVKSDDSGSHTQIEHEYNQHADENDPNNNHKSFNLNPPEAKSMQMMKTSKVGQGFFDFSSQVNSCKPLTLPQSPVKKACGSEGECSSGVKRKSTSSYNDFVSTQTNCCSSRKSSQMSSTLCASETGHISGVKRKNKNSLKAESFEQKRLRLVNNADSRTELDKSNSTHAQSVFSIDNITRSQLPPGVDPEVFLQLPKDMQQEVMQDLLTDSSVRKCYSTRASLRTNSLPSTCNNEMVSSVSTTKESELAFEGSEVTMKDTEAALEDTEVIIRNTQTKVEDPESPTVHTEEVIKNTEAAAKYTESPTKTVKTSTKSAETIAKHNEEPTEIIEVTVKKPNAVAKDGEATDGHTNSISSVKELKPVEVVSPRHSVVISEDNLHLGIYKHKKKLFSPRKLRNNKTDGRRASSNDVKCNIVLEGRDGCTHQGDGKSGIECSDGKCGIEYQRDGKCGIEYQRDVQYDIEYPQVENSDKEYSGDGKCDIECQRDEKSVLECTIDGKPSLEYQSDGKSGIEYQNDGKSDIEYQGDEKSGREHQDGNDCLMNEEHLKINANVTDIADSKMFVDVHQEQDGADSEVEMESKTMPAHGNCSSIVVTSSEETEFADDSKNCSHLIPTLEIGSSTVSSSETSKRTSNFKKPGSLIVPPDVDPEVFSSLPMSLQKELSLEWEIRNMQTSPKTNSSAKKLPKLNKRKDSDTILRFFRHDNKCNKK
ncbi:DNA polymerase iota-like isoform X2 [Gigantopelta aegis]|uniref:DNA polymerase iota-like isoform X2 n=1 Tax=Gigantopelta aegis TaxID=1735272 RepID=UPI001B88A796|nr:DNA polymerase iota-like isoform X2 [Gigantopelta aegis]